MSLSKDQVIQDLKEKLLLEKKLKFEYDGLPHLHGFKFYKWARKLYESRQRINLLCAANQISKSSTAIRKCIEMAGNPEVWPSYWKTRPRQFWYLYPSKEVATIEFEKKWEPEFLPRGEYKDHPTYGWTIDYKHGNVHELKFNSGVSVYFRAYSQGTGGYNKLQSGTCHAIFVDEELPAELIDELLLRLEATDGIFVSVFTATIGQDIWYRAIERVGCMDEAFKDALKMQISMYDCLEYEDGSKTPWNVKKIENAKNRCSTQQEIERRIYGRFVVDSGLIFPCFNRDKNYISISDFRKKHSLPATDFIIPKTWLIYSAVDIGGGGEGHPAAIVFLAVRPDYKAGVIFRGRRMDGIITTASDILEEYRKLRGKLKPIRQIYDWQAKDFFVYASRLQEGFEKAEKDHSTGEDLVNVLFKNGVLDILRIEDDEELPKLVNELTSLTKSTSKTNAKDDFCDAARYAAMSVPWDYSVISDAYIELEEKKSFTPQNEIDERRAAFEEKKDSGLQEIEDEIDYFNSLY